MVRRAPIFWAILALWHCHQAQAIVAITTTINNGSMDAAMSHGTKCAKRSMSVQVTGPGMTSVCPASVAAGKTSCKVTVKVGGVVKKRGRGSPGPRPRTRGLSRGRPRLASTAGRRAAAVGPAVLLCCEQADAWPCFGAQG